MLKGLLKIAVFLFILQALLAWKRMRSCVLILRMILVFLFFQILLQIDEERRDPDDGTYEMHYKQSSIWNKILVNEVKYSYSYPSGTCQSDYSQFDHSFFIFYPPIVLHRCCFSPLISDCAEEQRKANCNGQRAFPGYIKRLSRQRSTPQALPVLRLSHRFCSTGLYSHSFVRHSTRRTRHWDWFHQSFYNTSI